jgi:hypothetical protein
MIDSLIPPSPSEVARQAFNVHDPDIRRRSVAMLSAADFGGEPPYMRLYKLLIDDPDATVRAACVKAIGIHGSVEDAKLITDHVTDEDTFVRWEAAQALRKIHDPGVVAQLIRVVQDDEDDDVRMAAADALGQYAQARVYQALVGALDDRSFSVVEAAHRSLATLTGYDFGTEGGLWLMWADKQGDKLFKQQQPYTWQPYTKPRGLLDKAMFWTKPKTVAPRTPRGLEQPDAEDGQTPSSSPS